MNNDLNNNGQNLNGFNQMPGVNPQNGINQVTPDTPVQQNFIPYPQNPENYGTNGQPTKKAIDKKIIIAAVTIILAIVILFASGIIGGKKLTCTTEETSMGMTMKQELKFHFKKDKINKVVGKMSIDYKENIEYKDQVEESLEDQLEDLKEDGVNAKIKSGKTSTTLIITAEKDKLEDAFGMYEDDDSSYEEIKEYYEDDDYICK